MLIKHSSMKMETEQGVYYELLRLRFKIEISSILALAIIQNFQCNFFKPFLNQISKNYKNINCFCK